jgi:Ca-activated chloride channel family protein
MTSRAASKHTALISRFCKHAAAVALCVLPAAVALCVLPAVVSEIPTPSVAKYLAPGASLAFAQVAPFHFGVRVELVGLFATVHDSSGRLITGLAQNDFVIYDNGMPQIISQFSREYIPLSILVLLDTSGSMAGNKLDNARKSLIHFLKRLNPGDEAMLMTFQTRSQVIQGFTKDAGRIRNELRHLEGDGSTALYDTILTALDKIQEAHNRRRALLLISDGINTYGKTDLKETVAMLKKQGAELFAIGVEDDLPGNRQQKKVTETVLFQLTHSAGGEAFIASDSRDLGRICNTISERMHNQYSFAYYPPKAEDRSWRSIRIETKKPGLRVIPSKTGYFPVVN